VYRPGELVQCDLWEPRELIPVGHGQHRRGWVVTCEVCWSRAIAGTLIFSKGAPDILWALGRNLQAVRGAAGEAGSHAHHRPGQAIARSNQRAGPAKS
jgi:hypothetical protein